MRSRLALGVYGYSLWVYVSSAYIPLGSLGLVRLSPRVYQGVCILWHTYVSV